MNADNTGGAFELTAGTSTNRVFPENFPSGPTGSGHTSSLMKEDKIREDLEALKVS